MVSKTLIHNSKFVIPIVYSDYAHHPTEIRATLEALREKHPKAEITAVFQPHQQERLTRLFSEFARAFRGADRTIVLPVYRVKGRERMKAEQYTPERLARAIPGAQYAPTLGVMMRRIAANGSDGMDTDRTDKSNKVIVFMSAGDLDEKIRKLLSK